MSHVMKVFVVLFFLVMVVSCSKSPAELLVGEWKGTDNKGQTGAFTFGEHGSAEMTIGDRLISGKTIGGTVSWRVDDSYDPVRLDLVLKIPAKEPKTMPMIVRFLSDEEIELALNKKLDSRPAGFFTAGDNKVMTLRRQ